jgi:hypothetical protein
MSNGERPLSLITTGSNGSEDVGFIMTSVGQERSVARVPYSGHWTTCDGYRISRHK